MSVIRRHVTIAGGADAQPTLFAHGLGRSLALDETSVAIDARLADRFVRSP